jgi:hypothetical protein
MSDPQQLIEHVSERAPFPNDAFERMLRRRDRKLRNRRLAAAGVAITVCVVVAVIALRELGAPAREPAAVPSDTGVVFTFFGSDHMVSVDGVPVETTSQHPQMSPGTPLTELDMRYVVRPMIDVPAGATIEVGPEVSRAWVDVHDLSEPAQRLYELDLDASPSMPEEPGTYFLEFFNATSPQDVDGLTFLVPIRVIAPDVTDGSSG